MLSSLRCCSGRLHLPPRSEARKMSATRFSPDPRATMPGEALGLPIAKSARTQDRAESPLQFASTVPSYAVDFPAFRKRHGGDLTSPPKGL
jgi:hypothetical protein